MDAIAEIKHLYYNATRTSIQKDLARAVALLKAMPTEEDRERAAVYMDGLSQMRSEWAAAGQQGAGGRRRGQRPRH
jgi:hypothetical protein